MFKRKQPPPDVTNESFSQWLRAIHPPFDWFMRQPGLIREQLAILGDQWAQDLCVGIGYAVADPALADAGLDAAENPESEEVLIRRVAAKLVGGMVGGGKPEEPAQPTMGGMTARREAAARDEQNGKDEGRSFLGKAPDGAPAASEVKP